MINNAIQAIADREETWNTDDGFYQPEITCKTKRTLDGISIEIADNGVGMGEKTVHKAFDPLFTTRARGTGLGLSIVQKIVTEHGGVVNIESKLDLGTKVIVVIPVASQDTTKGDNGNEN